MPKHRTHDHILIKIQALRAECVSVYCSAFYNLPQCCNALHIPTQRITAHAVYSSQCRIIKIKLR